MEIKYTNDAVEKILTNALLIKRKCPPPLAKQLIKRLDQLNAFDNVHDLLNAPIDHPHLLNENLEGCIGWALTGSVRLILDTGLDKNPNDLTIFKEFKDIIIKGVIDYHDKKNKWIIN